MTLFGKQQEFFGLDISGTSVKVVQLKPGPSKPSLVAYGGMVLPVGSMQSDSEVDLQNVSNAIRQVVKKAKISATQCVAALPGSGVFTSIIRMPAMPKGELADSIRWQAKQYVPSPLEEVILDWHVVGEHVKKPAPGQKAAGTAGTADAADSAGQSGGSGTAATAGDKEIEVMLIAAPIALVRKYVKIISGAGLKAAALEIEPLSLARSVVGVRQEPVVVLDVGQAGSEISIVENGIIRLNRNTTAGGGALTRAISQSLGVDANRAEQFKRDFGLREDKLEGQIPKAVKPVLDTMVAEIRRSLDFYREQPHPQGDIREMVVVGGTARMPELLPLLSGTFGVEAKIGDPWANVNYASALKQQLHELAPSFSVTVGLAMREM
ncbi:MAG: pilus assembly protein PilM [Patescibacteria group bacterium]|nr:pilus assembly protein PilM [Patescibacteria group bacterium]